MFLSFLKEIPRVPKTRASTTPRPRIAFIRHDAAVRVMPVRIHEKVPIDVEGGVVVAAFPSFGLVATLAANFLIESLDLREVGSLESEAFPTLAIVEEGEPLAPVRLYAGTLRHGGDGKRPDLPVVLVLAEFQPDPPLVREVSQAILDWSHQRRARLVVSPEGLLVEDRLEDGPVPVYGAASTAALRDRLRAVDAPLFGNGLIAGVTGTLLASGKRDDVPVVGILAEANPDQPDARSAAAVVDLVARLLDVALDTTPLHDEADRFETKVAEAMRMQMMHERERGHTASVMYG